MSVQEVISYPQPSPLTEPGNQKNATFTKGYIANRQPHTSQDEFYDLSYFAGGKQDAGIQFPQNGAFLDPESEYRFKFQDLLFWIKKYVKKGTVLDVGTGPGHLAYWAKKQETAYSVFGCDISLSLLQSPYNQNPTASSVSTAYELPFANESFQAVIFSDVLEHVWPHQAVCAIEEAHRLLTDGGYVFVNIPNRITWSKAAERDQGHVWLPSISEVITMFGLGGFDPNKVETFTRGYPGSRAFRAITGQDLKAPLLGRSIFACVRK